MAPPQDQDGEKSATRAFLLLRYALICATAYLLIVEEGFGLPPLAAIGPVVAALGSNVLIGRLSPERLRSRYLGTALIIGDTAWITVALLASGRFSGDFFYLYFFVLLLAALGESLQLIAIGGVAACGAYFYILTASGNWSMFDSPSLIRIPFLATAAFFYGFLVDRTKRERDRADARTDELRAEADISAALVCVGHEMISTLDQPVVLDRLCQITAHVLECDASHTLLRDATRQAYSVVAGHGDPPELAQSLRLIQIPESALSAILVRLDADEVVDLCPPAEVLATLGLPQASASLWMAIRSGRELIGIHTASLRQAGADFSPRHRRIAHGIAQTASLALANARLFRELDKANRIKSDFVATMSHELRTPLNQIIGYTDLLREETFGPLTPEQTDVLGRVSHSSLNLLALIQETLDLSRLEAHEVGLQLETVDPECVLNELDSETRHLQAKPKVAFRWQVTGEGPPLRTDPMKLKMVLKNLVANAAKFTDEGSVVVTARCGGSEIEFSVADTGDGIAPEDQAVIFEPFRQLHRDPSRNRGGVGLGLYIARRLVDILGGSLALDSSLGHGSTFRVRLAAAPATAPPHDRAQS